MVSMLDTQRLTEFVAVADRLDSMLVYLAGLDVLDEDTNAELSELHAEYAAAKAVPDAE